MVFILKENMKIITKFLTMCLISVSAWAGYPDRPVKIIISLPAGSGPDVQLRVAAEVLSEKWGQPVVVENKPGGSGLVAMSQLTKDSSDGNTFAMFSVGDIVASPILFNKDNLLSYIEPLSPFFTADMVLFASPAMSNIKELQNEIQKNPMYGSWAVGSIGHLTGAEFANIYNKNSTHVPYKEYGPWYIDTANRVLSFGFTSLGSGNAMYRAGKIHYLAIASEQRNKKFPNVPTIREVSGKKIVAQSWLAFFIKKDVSELIKRQIEKDLRDAMSSQKVQSSLDDNFFIPMNTVTLKDFRGQIEKDQVNYATTLKKYNINIKE